MDRLLSLVRHFLCLLLFPFTFISFAAKPPSPLFRVRLVDGRYLFDIPTAMMGKEMLVVTRLLKSPPGLSVDRQQYGGEQENQQVWKWQARDHRVFVEVLDYGQRADSASHMLAVMNNSNRSTILYSFEVKTRDSATRTITIDVTDFYNGDIKAIGISDTLRKTYRMSGIDASRSYIDTIQSFPGNIEVRTVKTYSAALSPTDGSNGAITFELNVSMILLPEIPMKPRLFDPRVRYISQDQNDFGNGSEPVKITSFINRWRLEPRDTAAYARGELVEPRKPIVFYIDPATPEEWVPYFIKGVEDWEPAFEAAGFKNAIIARKAPTKQEDSCFSTEDARYNVIRYYPSDQGNAYGPIVCDPRTGEILESHIGWYHNQIKELHDWYFIQTAAANPQARKMAYSTEEMGQLVRYTICHEVGHTLGLPHNWGASHSYPVDSLRSKSFTSRHGTAASIMDYARFNYIAQPEDSVTQFSPRVGEYDCWSVKWGYTWFSGDRSFQQEKGLLDEWTKEKAADPLYFFGKEMTFYDPRAQHEDLGDNAILAGSCGIANLKRILPNLTKWTFQPGQDYTAVFDLYKQVLEQYWRYGSHVVTYVGGVYFNFTTYDQPGKAYEFVERSLQKEAVAFLVREFYHTPSWLLDERELCEIDNALIATKIQSIQFSNLNSLLGPARLARMLDNQLKKGPAAYSVGELLDDLSAGIFNGYHPDAFNRSLQREFIEILHKLVTQNDVPILYEPWVEEDREGYPPINVTMSDIAPLVMAKLRTMLARLPVGDDLLLKAHFKDLRARINLVINLPSPPHSVN
jgi:hypothetical protein